MKVILTEKPDVARKIASALGKPEKKRGYLQVGEYAVVWAFGHLFDADTKKMAGVPWKFENLPIIPERFELKPVSPSHAKQFEVIKKLLKKADRLIIATDAGPEGENIARKILRMARWTKWDRTYRFWTSEALTKETVRKTMRALRPASEFDGLGFSARAREEADWLVGINGSRAVTIRFSEAFGRSSGVWSVGRVQTPLLRLLVEREEEREKFVPRPYVLIRARFEKDGTGFEGILLAELLVKEGRGEEGELKRFAFFDLKFAERVLSSLKNTPSGTVVKVEEKEKREKPPLLHSLATLQKEANKVYGFPADKTERLAQALYEKHDCISYPRSASNHLGDGDKELAKKVLMSLGKGELLERVEKVGKRVFDSSKLTDHHAIIPLAPVPAKATDDEKKVYHLIWRRFVGAFMPDYRYVQTKVEIDVKGCVFLCEGKKVVELGWKELYPKEEEKLLPKLKRGENVGVRKVWKEEKETQPPPRYTDGTVIEEMRKRNLGTEATRHQIIKRLIDVGYAVREGRSLVPLPKGRRLIENIRNMKLASVELTSEWEKKLEEIRREGYKGYKKFRKEIEDFTRSLVEEIKILSPRGKLEVPSRSLPKSRKVKRKTKKKVYKRRERGMEM